MGQRVEVFLVDDYDGEPMEKDEAERIPLALDGSEWELDLRPENVDKLRAAIAPFVANVDPVRRLRAKRRKSRASSAPTATPDTTTGRQLSDAAQRRDKRAWAKANGWPDLGDRGRLPAEAEAAYAEAVGQ